MLKKIYFIFWGILSFVFCLESKGSKLKEFLIIMAMGVIYFYVFKLVIWWMKSYVRSKGGILGCIFSTKDTREREQRMCDDIYNAIVGEQGNSNAQREYNQRRREKDQQAYNRYKARDEAMWHQYQANQRKGTYEGYQAQQRAYDAWERSKR